MPKGARATSPTSFAKPTVEQEMITSRQRIQKLGKRFLSTYRTTRLNVTTIVDDELANGIICGRRMLTDAAKMQIFNALKEPPAESLGVECGKPSFMLPSLETEEYSFVSEASRSKPFRYN
jgi:hypothetical protein